MSVNISGSKLPIEELHFSFITNKLGWNLDMSFGTQLTLEGFFS